MFVWGCHWVPSEVLLREGHNTMQQCKAKAPNVTLQVLLPGTVHVLTYCTPDAMNTLPAP